MSEQDPYLAQAEALVLGITCDPTADLPTCVERACLALRQAAEAAAAHARAEERARCLAHAYKEEGRNAGGGLTAEMARGNSCRRIAAAIESGEPHAP